MLKTSENENLQKLIREVSQIVGQLSGVQLGVKQEAMVSNRLSARMLRLGIKNPSDYLQHLRSNLESESQALLSLMTTHHTYFFREFSHFEYLLNHSFNNLIARARTRPDRKIRIWSAACSTGQEVYSLAMFFKFHLKTAAPDVSFEILGTDIDSKSTDHARNGVYRNDELKSSPAMYVNGFWIRGTGEAEGFSKVRNDLKNHCRFEPLNLFAAEASSLLNKFDLIFCRNVFIYFNESQVRQLAGILLARLEPEGELVLGISETLMGLGLDASLVGPSTYRSGKAASVEKVAPKPMSVSANSAPEKICRVLCIDDSQAIHALLGKILTPEHGFEIGAKAKNGAEAFEILKTQSFDAMTLDLHMPELDGIGFLEKYKNRSSPILVLSSVNREEPSLGRRALELGAFDYVEKPSLENLAQAGNEIRAKLRTGLRTSAPSRAIIANDQRQIVKQEAIKVLVVDDSSTIRELLCRILKRDPAFTIVGEAERPSQVESLIQTLKPDLITLDIHMPEMTGVDLLKSLRGRLSVPVVMISSISREEGPLVLEALENGAIDYIQKPQISQLLEIGPVICERLKVAAQSKRRGLAPGKLKKASGTNFEEGKMIAIGSSTGGTEAVRIILEALPSQIPPILVVQHIPPVFSKAFADRLNSLCPFAVKEAEDGDEVLPNRVLIAPGGKQMGFRLQNGKKIVVIKDDLPMNRHKPSVDYLFKDIAENRHVDCIGVILTGMGADGAQQLKVLRGMGVRTVVQDEASSVVYGMPRAAVELGAAEFVLPLDQIPQKLLDLAGAGARTKARPLAG